MPVDIKTLVRVMGDLAQTPGARVVEVEGAAAAGADGPATPFRAAFLPPDWGDLEGRLRARGVDGPVEVSGLSVSGALMVAGLPEGPGRATVLQLVRDLRRRAGLGNFPFAVICTVADADGPRVAWRIASRGLLFDGGT